MLEVDLFLEKHVDRLSYLPQLSLQLLKLLPPSKSSRRSAQQQRHKLLLHAEHVRMPSRRRCLLQHVSLGCLPRTSLSPGMHCLMLISRKQPAEQGTSHAHAHVECRLHDVLLFLLQGRKQVNSSQSACLLSCGRMRMKQYSSSITNGGEGGEEREDLQAVRGREGSGLVLPATSSPRSSITFCSFHGQNSLLLSPPPPLLPSSSCSSQVLPAQLTLNLTTAALHIGQASYGLLVLEHDRTTSLPYPSWQIFCFLRISPP